MMSMAERIYQGKFALLSISLIVDSVGSIIISVREDLSWLKMIDMIGIMIFI